MIPQQLSNQKLPRKAVNSLLKGREFIQPSYLQWQRVENSHPHEEKAD